MGVGGEGGRGGGGGVGTYGVGLACVFMAYLKVKCANRHDVRATTMLQQT